jgi:UDP-2,4-diacetamido-2,4,6-trideoxy-beta-L-altropyranose hydrolase
MIIRLANLSDSSDILEWRNDPLSCAMFKNNTKVELAEHERWFKRSLSDPSKSFYLGLVAEKKIGVCRFDYDNVKTVSEVSINLNPLMRGQNFSFHFLMASINKYTEEHDISLSATIKTENKRSIHLFEKCGFEMINQNDDFYFFIRSSLKLTNQIGL